MAHCWWLFEETEMIWREKEIRWYSTSLCYDIYVSLHMFTYILREFMRALPDNPYLGFPLYFTHEEYIFMAWPYSVTLRAPTHGEQCRRGGSKEQQPAGVWHRFILAIARASGLRGWGQTSERHWTVVRRIRGAAGVVTFAALRACREPFRLLNTNDYGLRTTCLTCSMFVQVPFF